MVLKKEKKKVEREQAHSLTKHTASPSFKTLGAAVKTSHLKGAFLGFVTTITVLLAEGQPEILVP